MASAQSELNTLLGKHSQLACTQHPVIYALPATLVDALLSIRKKYSYARRGFVGVSPLLDKKEGAFEKAFASWCSKWSAIGAKGGNPVKCSWRPVPSAKATEIENMYRRIRGYAGYLISNQAFADEWKTLKQNFPKVIAARGYPLNLPNPRQLIPPKHVQTAQKRDAEFNWKYWCFCARWCLSGMLDEQFPSPCIPLKGLFGAFHSLQHFGTEMFIPWHYHVTSKEDLHSLTDTTAAKREGGLNALRKRLSKPKKLRKETPFDHRWVNYAALGEAQRMSFLKDPFAPQTHADIAAWVKIKKGITLEEFVAGSPALWNAPSYEFDWVYKEKVFLTAFYASVLSVRHAPCFKRTNRWQTCEALRESLDVKERRFKDFRSEINKTGYWP